MHPTLTRPTLTHPTLMRSIFLRPILAALCGLALTIPAAPAEAQGRPRAAVPAPDNGPPNPFASNYPSRPPEAVRPRPHRNRPAGEDLRPPRDIPVR
ncbi:hypothetical protein [Methylobacterium sp. J-090]|uniref:hypothetical protein n=1 Tax=Methylobacterium sp. J-090 TaxID=2836666 RepID=UPI001FBB298C|nr:hypothetical protein [Methylobacterium sp. J-090]MCJ2081361.1 hypothetical protein [Methylobacterium sp. J-090]